MTVPVDPPQAPAGRSSSWLLVGGLVLAAVVACLLVIVVTSADDGPEDASQSDQGSDAESGDNANDTANADSVTDEAEAASPTAGLSASEAAVAFVEALQIDSDELDGFADEAVLEEARAEPEYGAFVSFTGAEISANEECSFGDVTQVCLVHLNDPAGGAMAVEVGISVLPPDAVYDPDTGGVSNPDGSPTTAVPPRIVSVDLITS